jgi:aryl-alcohol dehydrogenase-like predicted oxidoreductase
VKKRAFGNTGIEVSEIGIGGWQLGEQRWNGPDETESIRLVHRALAAGVNFFDTAPCYADGRSEAILGKALSDRRGQVVICTKFGRSPEGTDFDHGRIGWSIESSLRRLQTDHLDIVLLHNPPAECLDGRSSPHFEVLERLREKGLVRFYGASVDWPVEIETVASTSRSRALEVWLSALHQEPWGAVEAAREQGLGTIIKVPLESGWLSGRYQSTSTFTDVRSRWSTEDIQRRAALVDRFRALLPPGVSVTHGALRFVLANRGVSTVIPGSKSMAQLLDNLAAAEAPLPADTVAAARSLFAAEIAGRPLAW